MDEKANGVLLIRKVNYDQHAFTHFLNAIPALHFNLRTCSQGSHSLQRDIVSHTIASRFALIWHEKLGPISRAFHFNLDKGMHQLSTKYECARVFEKALFTVAASNLTYPNLHKFARILKVLYGNQLR
jgi:hypothetical protein